MNNKISKEGSPKSCLDCPYYIYDSLGGTCILNPRLKCKLRKKKV